MTPINKNPVSDKSAVPHSQHKTCRWPVLHGLVLDPREQIQK